MSRHAQILSTGHYVPEHILPNAYFDRLLNRPVSDWLVENVGIHQRHVMVAGQTTSDLALAASRQALERAGLVAGELDLVIVATDTPDYLSPATATVLQHKLGATNAGTFDVNCACASWVTAVEVGAQMMALDSELNRVLVVGAYGMSRFVDYSDHYTCTLFADGAGAVVLGAAGSPGYLAGKRQAYGAFYDALGIYTGGATCPVTPAGSNGGRPRVEFVRKFPATFNAEHWPRLVRATVDKAGLTLEDVDLYLFTQLNVNTIKNVMAILDQPLAKTHWIMDKWGYTGSACIPMALDDAITNGRGPKAGDIVLFCASGGGISMACNVWQWIVDG
jgi:3-oxoacyl-[acyl-carrier-protein] synthase III